MNGHFRLRKNSGWCGERFGSGGLTEAGKVILAFAAVRQRRSVCRVLYGERAARIDRETTTVLLDSGGAVLEEMGEWKDCCAFVFSEMPGSFLRDVYWWMAEHGCGEEVYAQYSVLEHVDAEDATVSALKEKTRLDILMDDTHPVLLLQLAPASPLAPVTEALASACGREGWTLCVK